MPIFEKKSHLKRPVECPKLYLFFYVIPVLPYVITKKRGSQIFRLRRASFVVEALKTAKKPLKTAKNRYIFLKTSIFLKKGT